MEELRDVVKIKIVETIQKPIRAACDKFVEEGRHIGPGVKYRILDMFRDLAASATQGASGPTERTLRGKYSAVEIEIRKAFEDWGHPLESALNAIVERHEDRTRRSDSQKRQKVLGEIERLRHEALEAALDAAS